jgi:hypothetical protein
VGACAFDAFRPLLSSPFAAACLSYASTLFLTSCFHLDGVGDAFDGIGGGWSQSEILRIMKDSRLGVFPARPPRKNVIRVDVHHSPDCPAVLTRSTRLAFLRPHCCDLASG